MNQENLGAASIATVRSLLTNYNNIYDYMKCPLGICFKQEPCNMYYAITITPALASNDNYDFFKQPYARLKRFRFLKQVWELTQVGRLHTHILAEGPENIKYKLIHLYGWHIHIEPLLTTDSKLRWESYMNKYKDRDILLEHSANKPLFD